VTKLNERGKRRGILCCKLTWFLFQRWVMRGVARENQFLFKLPIEFSVG
jgi:hypothetical protein